VVDGIVSFGIEPASRGFLRFFVAVSIARNTALASTV